MVADNAIAIVKLGGYPLWRTRVSDGCARHRCGSLV